MARPIPFHGVRYDPKKVGRTQDVVSQPYDKISAEMCQDYLKRHPCNIVRVIKNKNYNNAGNYLNRWIQEGVLKKDTSPAFYPYEQQFKFEGETLSRLGFIGLISLRDGQFSVKGHERVMNNPLEDRLNLIRSTEANEGLIFMLYSDPTMRLDKLLSEFTKRTDPLVSLRDENGITNNVWKLTKQDLQKQITDGLRNKTLYIADGHHRFQTSLLYYQECRKKHWQSTELESFDKRMVGLFNTESPGIRILPTHRGIFNLKNFNLNDFLSRLNPFFKVQHLKELWELDLALKHQETSIGLVAGKKDIRLLRLKNRAYKSSDFMPGVAGPARRLSVNILHSGILEPVLGIGTKELASQQHIKYHRDRNELIQSVHENRYQLAFILNPTQLAQVREISEIGKKMPPKSTDFYPKLLTGLVMMKMQIKKPIIT